MQKLLIISAALALAACGQTTNPTSYQTTRPVMSNYEFQNCRAELKELEREVNGNLRRAYAAENAYIATRNDKVAKQNVAMMEQDAAAYQAKLADFKRRCLNIN